ncbi:MAG: tetratricopeptide repeat protein, partial [Bacteroidota bacterium]
MKKLVILTALIGSSFSFSQDKLPFIDRDEIFNLVAQSGQEGNPEKALEYLNKINKNDSTYCSNLASKAYYLLALKDYDKAISTADQGLENKWCTEEYSTYYINKAVAHIGLKQYDKAIEVIDTGLKDYPNQHLLWFNKGVALESLGQINKAVEAYKQTIILNPFYAKPHLQLGNICYKQEKMTQALMCYNMYLLLIADSDGASNVLKSLNSLVATNNSNTANPDIKISVDDTSFEELDLILSQKLALREGYQTTSKVDEALVKQSHVLIQQLEQIEGNNGLWASKYMPFFNWIRDKDYFNDFIYVLFYSTENEDYQKLIKKNTDNISAYLRRQWLSIVLCRLHKTQITFPRFM